MLGVAVPPQAQVAMDLQVLFVETEGTGHLGDITRISGHLVFSGQCGHTSGFLPPVKQRKTTFKIFEGVFKSHSYVLLKNISSF